MKLTKHNPDCKLISTIIDGGNKEIELVYGETNKGTDKGLEIYYTKKGSIGHYRSYRYDIDNVPKAYIEICNSLSNHIKDCPAGHKLSLR